MARPKKITVEELQEQLQKAYEIIAIQNDEINRLRDELNEKGVININVYNALLTDYNILKANCSATKHNARGAGRKQKYDSAIIAQAKQLHEQGLSYGNIAKELNMNKSSVYKLINER